MRRTGVVLLALALAGCGTGSGGSAGPGGASTSSTGLTTAGAGGTVGGAATGTTGDTTVGSTGGSGSSTSSTGSASSSTSSTSSGSTGGCLTAPLLSAVGRDHLLVGASMVDATATAAPWDLRYIYLSGGFFDGSEPCASCASGCTAQGQDCSNSGSGCAWWGCWQYDQVPPGDYARGFFGTAASDGQLPMISYYEILQGSGVNEGSEEVTVAAADPTFMHRYLADWRFLLQQVGTQTVFLQIEPDFWGYAEQVGPDPTQLPAAVASADATECGAYPDTIAGLGQCLIHMVRVHAPNAKVGLHGSSWATGPDVTANTDPSLDVAAEAQKLAAFLRACGGDRSDFVTVDASDRDAAWYQTQGRDTWWDPTNQALPDFTQAFAWSTALAEGLGKPVLWWQVPVGNMQLGNVSGAWQDNRVDYFFDHPDELAASHAVGMAFGAGAAGQTTPESDDGHLVSRANALAQAGGEPLCH